MERAKRFLQSRRGRLALAAGGMAVILCAVYAACRFWPFGPNSVMTGDLNSQYIPFYAHFYDAVRSGGSLFYADDLGMGGGAFALFAYYFASPFAWLYLVIAPEFYGQLCCIVYAAKVILAAAAFCFYLERRWGGEKALWLPLCWCYGLMGYSLAYAQNVLWLDAVILLPLVCAGLDRLLAGRGAVGFCLALAAAIFTNFYMGYMLCIFSGLYFVAGLAVRTPRPGAKVALSACGRFAAAGVTAAALAGAVLVPAVREILQVKSTGLDLSGGGQFSPLDLIQKFFTGNFVWSDVQTGLPPVYCGMLGLGAALLYFFSARPRREKLIYGLFAALLLVSLWWRPLDLAWHGFAAPNWFPYRESFLLVFLLLSLGAGALTGPVRLKRGLAAGAVAATLGVLVYFTRVETYGRRRWLLACCLLAAAIGLVWLWGRLQSGKKRLAALALAALTAGELALNGYWALRLFEVYPVAEYVDFVRAGRATVRAVEKENPENYRVEKTFFRTLNDPMLLGYEGLTHFSSVQDGASSILLMALGYRNFGSSYGYLSGSTAAADSLLSVGWFLAREGGAVPTHFEQTDIAAPWQVYKNPNALPRALWSPSDAAAFDLAEGLDAFEAAETLYAALLGRKAALFTPVESAGSGEEFQLTMPKGGILYAVFSGQEAGVSLEVNGQKKGAVFSTDRSADAAVDLGRFEAGEAVEVTLDTAVDARFAVLDEETLAAACEALREAAPTVTSWKDGAVTLETSAQADGLAVLTVPWDENWQAEVDGAPAEIQKAAGALLAVELPAGSHTLRLRYTQPGAAAGLGLTLAGAVALAALAVWQKKQNGKER